MLSKKQVNAQIRYWHKSSEEKLKTMQGLYRIRRYADCLFFGHLVLEKALKALVVKETREHPPKTHNLIRLSELARVSLKPKDILLLAKANDFNLDARYPDYKLNFYKLCTKLYSDPYYKSIINLYKTLCQLAK